MGGGTHSGAPTHRVVGGVLGAYLSPPPLGGWVKDTAGAPRGPYGVYHP